HDEVRRRRDAHDVRHLLGRGGRRSALARRRRFAARRARLRDRPVVLVGRAAQAPPGRVRMRRVRAFGHFWWVFVVGDDWRAGAGEDVEIAGLEVAAGDRHAHVPLYTGVVRTRHAHLAEAVGNEAGAVEAAGARATPAVRRAEVAHRRPDDAAVLRGRSDRRPAGRCRRADRSVLQHERLLLLTGLVARLRRLLELELASLLGRDNLRDLTIDRGVEPVRVP